MAVSLTKSPVFIKNNTSEVQNLEDWSLVIQSPKSNDSILRIPVRRHALTIVGHSSQKKCTFAFNFTYQAQIQNSGVAISEKIKSYIQNGTLTDLWKIQPYKEQRLGAFEAVDKWMTTFFPSINVKNVKLGKDDCFIIDRKKGRQKQEHKVESVLKKVVRQKAKVFSVLFHQESSIKISS